MQMHLGHSFSMNAGFHLGQSFEHAQGLLLDGFRQAAFADQGLYFCQVAPMPRFEFLVHNYIHFCCAEPVFVDLLRVQFELPLQV